MKREHPNPQMALPISIELYQQLAAASFSNGLEQEPWEIGASALREWMIRHRPETFAMPTISGYQWKSLFLPDGTLLRTSFNGNNFHCLVEKDRIRYDGKEISPSGFANAVGGVRRNAWKVIWVLLPNTSTWKPANSLRARAARTA